MGRRTWEGLPNQVVISLLGRTVLILCSQPPSSPHGLCGGRWCKSLSEALEYSHTQYPDRDIWIAGGAQVYRSALDAGIVDEVVLTRVLADFPGDVAFPGWDRFRWVDHGQHGWDWLRAEYQDAWGSNPLCRVEVWRPAPDAEEVANGR